MCALRQRIKIFPLVVVKSRMGAVHSTGESWHMAEGLWWRVCSSIWQAQGSRSTGSHSRLNILCFWLGDLLPQPKFGSQTKTVEENTTFDQTISPPPLCFFALLPLFKWNLWKQRGSQGSGDPSLPTFKSQHEANQGSTPCSAWQVWNLHSPPPRKRTQLLSYWEMCLAIWRHFWVFAMPGFCEASSSL